jgi:D-alanine-D-alanine ligase
MTEQTRKPRVAVLFGGRSSEHAISCVTAGSVLSAIDRSRYDVVPIGIATDGRWVLESGNSDRLRISSPDSLPRVDGGLAPVTLAGAGAASELVVHRPGQVPETLGEVDVVFPLLHGPWGEDGTIQGLLEMAGVRYVGAGVLASAAGMDKHYMKVLFQASGLPVLPHALITARDWETDRAAASESVDSLGYPVFVKPCRGGSSIGISKVRSHDELADAVEEARQFDPKVIVEASAGEGAREVECGVLQGFETNPADASVVAEITVDPQREFYDFEAKYLPGDTGITVPAKLSDDLTAKVQDLAVRAFDALSCEGLARVDFFVLPDDRLIVNEINTMPGFTPTSMFPLVWAESGLDYPALVDRLIQLALHRPDGLR